MVFQLITFFMLVINFKSAELDLTLKLPVVGSARPVNTGAAPILVLNVRAGQGPSQRLPGHLQHPAQQHRRLHRQRVAGGADQDSDGP